MRPRLDQLEALLWIVRLGSFRAAARQLHLSQPAISGRIRELEGELGFAVVDRTEFRPGITPKGAEVVRYWREQSDRWRADGPWDDAYPLPWSTGSVNLVRGGTAPNIVPDRCEVVLEFRAIAAVDDHAVVADLRRFCAALEGRMRDEHAVARVALDVAAMTPGLETPEDSPVVRFGEALGLAVNGDKVTYGTEAGVFSAGGIPTVVCGPGDIAQAHKADEFVALDQLAAGEAFVARLLGSLRAA